MILESNATMLARIAKDGTLDSHEPVQILAFFNGCGRVLGYFIREIPYALALSYFDLSVSFN